MKRHSLHHYHSKFSQGSTPNLSIFFVCLFLKTVLFCVALAALELFLSLCRPRTHRDPSRIKGMCDAATTMLNLSNFNGPPKKLKNILECSDSLPLNSVILKVWGDWFSGSSGVPSLSHNTVQKQTVRKELASRKTSTKCAQM